MLDILFYTIFNWPERIIVDNYSCHNFHEIGYVLDGEGAIELLGKIYPIRRNSFLIIPKNNTHREISGRKKLTILYIGFLLKDDTLWNELEASAFDLNNFNILSEIRLLVSEMKRDSQYKEEIMSRMFEVLFLELHRTVAQEKDRSLQSESEDFIHDAINYMKENISSDIDLMKISNRYNLNRNYFTTVFKRKTGLPPASFLKQLRIDVAKKMLLDGGYTITEVACKIGITDPYYLSRIFKEITGMSPTAFRKSYNLKDIEGDGE